MPSWMTNKHNTGKRAKENMKSVEYYPEKQKVSSIY